MIRDMGREANTNQRRDDGHLTTVRLPRDHHRRLKALAAAQERTVSQQVRLLVARYLEDAEGAEEVAA